MSKRFVITLTTLGFASAALAEKTNLDVFVSTPGDRAIVDVRALSPMGQRALTEGRVSTIEPRLGVPTFFWAAAQAAPRSLRDMGLSPEQAARRHLFTHGELYRQDPKQIAEARVAHVHDTGDGAVIVAFHQDSNGIRVFRDELKVLMNQQLQLIALSGYLTPERKPLAGFQLTPASAIAAAFADLTGTGLEAGRLTDTNKVVGGYAIFELAGEPTPVRARKAYFPTAAGLEPGFYVELQVTRADSWVARLRSPDETADRLRADDESTGFDYLSYLVSARDGRIMFRKNLTVNDAFAYRVWADATTKIPQDGPQGDAPSPHPTGTRNQYNPPYVLPTLVTLQNGPISTNDPWLPATAVDTRGNNADAYADLASPSGFGNGDLRASLTGALAFDRVYDTAQSPNVSPDQRMAAVTQLFYNVNFLHDWYYDKGFDEAGGNAQTDNFGRGGIGNDSMRAEAEDYSGKNNANMSTPSDGARPVMQMYVFDGGGGPRIVRNGGGNTVWAGGSASFGPQAFVVTGDVVYANDGSTAGSQGTVNDGCQPFVTNVTGKIALVDRGSCVFTDKAANAQAAGAIAVIIANNTFGGANDLTGTSSTTIPALSISRGSGTSMKSAVAAGTVNVTMTRTAVTDRDGTIDNAIVAHEWGHYLSNRLIGDGNGISNNQAVGMGEGWGDFTALLMVVREGDRAVPSNANYNGVYALAAYTSYGLDPDGYYFGIRRLPMSTDMTKNGLTFKHITDNVPLPANVPTSFGLNGQDNAEVHNTGEFWATVLWECYAALLRDTNRLTFEQANDRMRGYLVASLKLTPLMPTMVEARDAVLAAAAAKDSTDFALFSAAFAKRGMGMKAIAPSRDSQTNSGVVESFISGNDLAIVAVKLDDAVTSCDNDGILDNDETGRIAITVKNVGTGSLMAATATVTTGNAAAQLANGGTVMFPTIPPFGVATAYVGVALKNAPGNSGLTFGVSVTEPTLAVPGPVTATAPFRVNFDVKTNGSQMDDVESPTTLWSSTSDPNGNTGSNWRRFEGSATDHYWFGPNPSSPADTWLTSPVLSVGTAAPLVITFDHRWEFEGTSAEYFDGGVVEISADNGPWVDVGASLMPAYTGKLTAQGANPLKNRNAFVGKSAGYPAFIKQTLSLGSTYAGKSIRLRFRIGSDDAAALKGWEIDNIDFGGLMTKPFPTVAADPNACGNRPPVIAAGPDQIVDEGRPVTLKSTVSDADGDAVIINWQQSKGPMIAFNPAGDGFIAPEVDADTELTFELRASDGKSVSGPVETRVLVRTVNKRPVANAGEAIAIAEGAAATLTGMGTDAEGEAITYQWTQVSGPAVPLTDANTAALKFTAPQVVADTKLVFELTVTAGGLESIPSRVDVQVLNLPPEPKPVTPPPNRGCGCSAGTEGLVPLLGFVLLGLWSRRKR